MDQTKKPGKKTEPKTGKYTYKGTDIVRFSVSGQDFVLSLENKTQVLPICDYIAGLETKGLLEKETK